MKSWLQSKTIRFAFISFLITVGTVGKDFYETKKFKQEYLYIIGGAAAAFYKEIEGRIEATEEIYTPNFLPGKTKAEYLDHRLKELSEVVKKPTYIENEQQLEAELVQIKGEESKSNGEVNQLDLVNRKKNSKYQVTTVKKTFIKTDLADSTTLLPTQKRELEGNFSFDICSWNKSHLNHISVYFENDSVEYFLYIPDIQLRNSQEELVGLVDNLSASIKETIDQSNKTEINLPGIGKRYLEDPVHEGGYISWSEMTKGWSRPLTDKYLVQNCIDVCKLLDTCRKHFGSPAHITSGYRDPASNAACGGSSQSVHLSAGAADFYIDGVSEQKVYDYIEYTLGHAGGLAIKPGVFTHIDIAGLVDRIHGYSSYRRWFY